MTRCILTAIALSTVSAVASAVIVRSVASANDQRSVETLRDFCVGVKLAMHDDWRAFASTDSRQREAAYNRFYEGQTMFHNASSMLMCLDDIPTLPLRCRLDADWDCLADLAKQIENLL